MVSDVDFARRMIGEVEDIFGLVCSLKDENDELPSRELSERLGELMDAIIEYRCAIESAYYEGTDHFDQED